MSGLFVVFRTFYKQAATVSAVDEYSQRRAPVEETADSRMLRFDFRWLTDLVDRLIPDSLHLVSYVS